MTSPRTYESRPMGAALASITGDAPSIADLVAAQPDITAVSDEDWPLAMTFYALGLDHGRRAAEAEEDARTTAAFAQATGIMRRATSWPVLHPETLTASSDELTAAAAERERRGVERFRAGLGRSA